MPGRYRADITRTRCYGDFEGDGDGLGGAGLAGGPPLLERLSRLLRLVERVLHLRDVLAVQREVGRVRPQRGLRLVVVLLRLGEETENDRAECPPDAVGPPPADGRRGVAE